MKDIPYPRSLWLAVAGALFGAFQFGYQVGVLNTALHPIAKDLHYHKDGVLSSAVVLGAAAGAITAGKLADTLGPRHAQVANCLAFLVGSVTAALASNHVSFLAGRFIAGIGAGAASLYVPRYIAEVSPPPLRGRLGSLNQVLINTGILVAYCSAIPYELGFTGMDVAGGVWCSWWRIMLGAGLLPATLQVFVLAWCPESPVWLESIGRRDAADAACLKLWGVHALMPGPDFDTTDTAAAAAAVQHHTTHTALSASSQLLLQQPLLLQVPPPGAGGFSGGGGGGSSTGPSSKASSLRGPYEGSLQASPVRRLHPQQQHPTAAEQFHLPPHLRTTNTAWDSPHAAVGSGWDGGSSSSFGGIPGALLAGSPAWTDAFSGGAFAGARPGDLGVGTERSAGGWDSLLQRQYSWMMLLALGLPLLQQASGINTVIFFSSQVFAAAGLQSPIVASIVTGSINLVFTVLVMDAMDRYGRKPLLLLSHTGMCLSLGAVSALSLIPLSADVHGWVMVGLVLVYVAFFALGSGPVTWVLLAEVLPPQIKGPAASLATAAGWAGNLVVTGSFDTMLQHLGLGGTYLLYAFANAAGVAYVLVNVIETKQRSLAEIEQLLLLPDRDPRLTALLPALQRSNSNVSSTGLPSGTTTVGGSTTTATAQC